MEAIASGEGRAEASAWPRTPRTRITPMPTRQTPAACAADAPVTERDDADDQHEDRRSAAGDRIDDRQLGARVGRRQQREVDELQE